MLNVVKTITLMFITARENKSASEKANVHANTVDVNWIFKVWKEEKQIKQTHFINYSFY